MVPLIIANGEIREALLTVARAMITQVNRDIGPIINAMNSTMTSKLRDFVMMNPLVFLGSNVGEDPQEFLDEGYKILDSTRVTYRER